MEKIRRFQGSGKFDTAGLVSGEMLFKTVRAFKNPSGAQGHSEADAKNIFWQHQIPENVMNERMPGKDAYVQVRKGYKGKTRISLVIVPKGGEARPDNPQYSFHHDVETGITTAVKVGTIKEEMIERQLKNLFGEEAKTTVQTKEFPPTHELAKAFGKFITKAVPNFRIESSNYPANREEWHEMLEPFEEKIKGFETTQTIKLVR